MNIQAESLLQSILSSVKKLSEMNTKNTFQHEPGEVLRDLRRIDNDIDDLVASYEP